MSRKKKLILIVLAVVLGGGVIAANALLQRIPPAEVIEAHAFRAKPGSNVNMNELVSRLEKSGFERVPTVRDVGEFAVRGGILDL